MLNATHILAGIGDFVTWYQGVFVVLLIAVLIAYKLYKDKYQS